MNTPFFSIILPTYNRWHLLPRAINSVINQSFKDFELIICDDGSTDETPRLLKKNFSDPRIKYFYLKHKGVSHARNFGISQSKGQYIAFLDSDDEYLNNHLSSAFEFIKKQNPIGLIRSFAIYGYKKQKITVSNNKKHFLLNSTIFLPTIICNQSILNQLKFNETYSVAEDYNLWIKILRYYSFYEIPLHTVKINPTINSLSQEGGNKKNLEYVKTVESILKEMKATKNKLGTWFFKINLGNRFSYYINTAYSKKQYLDILKIGTPLILKYPRILFCKNNFRTLLAAIARIILKKFKFQ